MAPSLRRRRFTVVEYHEMARAGILSEDDRLELIEGEIVEMTPSSAATPWVCTVSPISPTGFTTRARAAGGDASCPRREMGI